MKRINRAANAEPSSQSHFNSGQVRRISSFWGTVFEANDDKPGFVLYEDCLCVNRSIVSPAVTTLSLLRKNSLFLGRSSGFNPSPTL